MKNTFLPGYCMNIHPYGDLEGFMEALRVHPPRIAELLGKKEPLKVGIWLPASAFPAAHRKAGEAARLLEEANACAFTANAFPWGRFHRTRVKEKAYVPSWHEKERLDYTLQVAQLLVRLLPEETEEATVSTLPLGYGRKFDIGPAVENVRACLLELAALHRRTGKRIRLVFEPEPFCAMETAEDVERVWEALRQEAGEALTAEYAGVCVDLAHAVCVFEDPAETIVRLEEAGMRVGKVHLSAAAVSSNKPTTEELQPLADSVYLHQTFVKRPDGRIERFEDLPEAMKNPPEGRWRIHYHLPFDWQGVGLLHSSGTMIDRRLLEVVFNDQRDVGMEVYTFDLLHGGAADVDAFVAEQMRWLEERRNRWV